MYQNFFIEKQTESTLPETFSNIFTTASNTKQLSQRIQQNKAFTNTDYTNTKLYTSKMFDTDKLPPNTNRVPTISFNSSILMNSQKSKQNKFLENQREHQNQLKSKETDSKAQPKKPIHLQSVFGYSNLFENPIKKKETLFSYRSPLKKPESKVVSVKAVSGDVFDFNKERRSVDLIISNAISCWKNNKPREAEKHFCDALAFFYKKACKSSPGHQPLFLFEMANILHSRGLLTRKTSNSNSWRHYTRAYYIFLKLGIAKPEVYPILVSLAQLFINEENQYKEASHLLLQALRIYSNQYSDKSWVFLNCLIDLVLLNARIGNWEMASDFCEKAISCHSKMPHSEEILLYRLKKLLSNIYEKGSRLEASYKLNIEVLKELEAKYGNRHVNVLKHLLDIAKLLQTLRKFSKSEEIYKRCIEGFSRNFGRNSVQVAAVMSSLAALYVITGKITEAMSFLLKSLSIRHSVFGEKNFSVAENYFKVAILHWALCQFSEAERFMIKSYQSYASAMGARNENTLYAKRMLNEIRGRCCVRIEKPF